MSKGLRRRFWAEMGLGLASAVFVLLTLLWKDWVEIVFKVDPDHHGGSLEWAIVGVAVVGCFSTLLAARLEWREGSAAPASPQVWGGGWGGPGGAGPRGFPTLAGPPLPPGW